MYWKTIDRPGYFGLQRNTLEKRFDKEYGLENWRLSWEWGKLILQKPQALQLYEDAYYEHLKNTPELLGWLTTNFANVCDTALSNVYSHFNYDVQETKSNHLHDIAIRRAVMRLGIEFKGRQVLWIRNPKGEGNVLNPHRIPFHIPELIYQGPVKYQCEKKDIEQNPPWYIKFGVPKSVEMFYQHNKLLQVRKGK